MVQFSDLIGKTITQIDRSAQQYGDILVFHTACGKKYRMLHYQDCCESVEIEDICGDLTDIMDSEILEAEEVCNTDETGQYESATWTFYKIGTVKGRVTLRWLGVSNGYYSESVSFVEGE